MSLSFISAVILGILSWTLILKNWRNGIWAYVSYAPWSGAISVWLAPQLWPKVFSDLAILLPTYVAFLFDTGSKNALMNFPRGQKILAGIFVILVGFETLNPHLLNGRVALIGLKVWLFYWPLLPIGYRFLIDSQQFNRLTKLIVFVACAPALVGLAQYVSSALVGYGPTMRWFYHGQAAKVTQNFTAFRIGASEIYRIPSLFSFPTQYLNSLLVSSAWAYGLMSADVTLAWRRFGVFCLTFFAVAGYLSGARSSFLLIPGLWAGASLLHQGKTRAVKMGVGAIFLLGAAVLGAATLTVSRALTITRTPHRVEKTRFPQDDRFSLSMRKATFIGWKEWNAMMRNLILNEGFRSGFDTLIDSIQRFPWGLGTGMSTGAARNAVSPPVSWKGYESLYAKTVAELGVGGLLILLLLQTAILLEGFRCCWKGASGGHAGMCSAFLAVLLLFVIADFKSAITDLDPANAYFWLMTGLLYRLSDVRPRSSINPSSG